MHATFVAQLAAKPSAMPPPPGGRELIGVTANLAGPNPIALLLQCRADSSLGPALLTYNAGDLLIASGDLALDESGNLPVLTARVLCRAHSDQYLNEISAVGRLAGDGAKLAESGKSASRSLAVNRYAAGEEQTDWWKIRGYGWATERLGQLAKGALIELSGSLEQRTTKAGGSYCEIKIRTLKSHAKSRAQAGATPDPAKGTSAAGYAHADFTTPPELPTDWS